MYCFWRNPGRGSVTLVLTPTCTRTFDLHADIERGVTVVRFGRRECVVDPSVCSLLTLSQWLSSGWPECSVAQATRFAKVITIAGLAAHEETAGNVLTRLQMNDGQPTSVFSGVTSSVEPRGGEWREAACLLLATIPGLWLAKIVLRGTHAAPRIGAMTSAGGPDD